MEELHPTVTVTNLLNLWRSKCPPGDVPRRAEFDVLTLQAWLGWLTVYEEVDDGADFLVRLDGSNIVALTGDEWTGRRMSELDPRYMTPVLEVLRRAVRERQPIVDQYYTPAVKDFLTFHRITLPLWEDRRGVWQVIQGMQPVRKCGSAFNSSSQPPAPMMLLQLENRLQRVAFCRRR